jgi:hypothetical protein
LAYGTNGGLRLPFHRFTFTGNLKVMKKIILMMTVSFATVYAQAQFGGLLKKVTKEVLGGDDKTEKKEKAESNDNNKSKEKKNEPQTPPTNGTLAFTLDEGERIMYDEASITGSKNNLSWKFVTYSKEGKYFLIDNGNRTGPFDDSPITSKRAESGESGSASSLEGDEKVAKKYTKLANGKPTIVFNGKTYGPYLMVQSMVVSADKQHFFAVALEGNSMMDMSKGKGVLFSEKGKQELPGMPFKLKASPGFSVAVATVMDMKAANNGNSNYVMVNSKGKKSGPIDIMSSGGDDWLDEEGNVYSIPSQSPTELLVNGVGVAKFDIEIEKSRLVIAPDPSKSIMYMNGKIYNADGTISKSEKAIYPSIVMINNVMNLCWFQLYKNPATNQKEVYVCKKPIV